MPRVIVYLVLLDLFSVTLQIAGFPEDTFVSNSSVISCAWNKKIAIVDLRVNHHSTSNSEYKKCNLTVSQRNTIRKGCDQKRSCTIATIIPDSCVYNNYGHVSVSYSCKAITNSSCSFANGMCGWKIHSFDERYKWEKQSGQSRTGPNRDHTTASANGHYMYARSRRHSKTNDSSDLLSGLIVPSPKQCLTFWYHMYGDHINTLKVFQLNTSDTVELWNKSSDQGNKWFFQSLALTDIGYYQIKFKATRGDGYKSEIAIDDITITNTACKQAIDCNFETGPCGWKAEETTYKWINLHDSTPTDDTGPDVDHTLGTRAGWYIYLKASNISPERKSKLTSEIIYPDGDACFTFWYYLYGKDMGTLTVYLDIDGVSTKIWSKARSIGKRWVLASLNITSSEPHTIIFEGIRGKDSKGDIALDDIVLLPGLCEEAFSSDCHFEEGNCNWSTDSDTQYVWKNSVGSTMTTNTGPVTDRTTGLADGHYIYLEGSGPTEGANFKEGIKSNLTSTIFSQVGDTCFTFWYHMYGRNIGTLNVYTKSGNITKKQWSQHKNQGNSWKFANFDIFEKEPFRIIFEGIRGNGLMSDIALDDILLHRRSCPGFHVDCDFERGNCNWSIDPEKSYIWTLSSGSTSSHNTGPDNDHTTGLSYGHYIYLEGSHFRKDLKSNLSSATINHVGDTCFSFWYHMYGKDIGHLNVYTKSKKITIKQWSQDGNQRNAWTFANFTISKTEPFRIIFEGIRGDGSESDIALDDISLTDGSCSGLIKTSQTWKTDETISLHECSKYYLQLNETSLVFDRQLDNCSAVYQDVQTSVATLCNNFNNSDICTFYLPKLIRKDQRCFPSNPVWLTVEYKCKVVGSSTTSPGIATKKGSSKAVGSSTTSTVTATTKGPRKATTLESVATSRNVSNAIGDTSGTSVLGTGFVVGLIIGGVILACVVIVIVILIIRHKSQSRPKEKKRNILKENDYIGSQDIALPLTAHHSSQNQNDGKFRNTSNVVRHETILSDNQTLNDERYSIGDQTAETSFKKTLEDGKGTTGSYIVLDPSVTGFNRTKLSKTPSDYEFGKPVIDTEIKSDDEDKYAICEEGVYDHSGNNRYKESEVNIYNHAVDNIYDSGSQKRNDEGRDDTYDHFFGQKTEDDYDITRT